MTINQMTVDESLDSAIENGYELDEELAIDIAEDLTTYDARFEHVDIANIVPLVDSWKCRRKSAITILVDDARHIACVPYTRENLHRVADWLGLKRCWFHGGARPHYDVPKRRIVEFECPVALALLVDAALLDEDEDDPPRVSVKHVTTRAFVAALRKGC